MRVIAFCLSISLLTSAIIIGLCFIPSQFWWAEMLGGFALLIVVAVGLWKLNQGDDTPKGFNKTPGASGEDTEGIDG